jgi:AcrR family transcriptional regulator
MERTNPKRAELTGRIADVLLAEGVAQVALRDLAARLGTSDRMLLYYFDDKADLVRASIAEISVRLDTLLAGAGQTGRQSPAEVLRSTAGFLSLPQIMPFMNVWADILARGGRGEEPFKAIAHGLVQASLTSLDGRLAIEDETLRRRTAGAILAAVEGVWILEMASPGSTEGALELLARPLERAP